MPGWHVSELEYSQRFEQGRQTGTQSRRLALPSTNRADVSLLRTSSAQWISRCRIRWPWCPARRLVARFEGSGNHHCPASPIPAKATSIKDRAALLLHQEEQCLSFLLLLRYVLTW